VTKSKGIGRGGFRPGAGRKRSLGAVEIEAARDQKPETAIRKAARAGGKVEAVQIGEALGWAPDEVAEAIRPGSGAAVTSDAMAADELPLPETAESMRGVALATLRSVMKNSPSDPARVSAAKEVLARADAERELAGMGGKKGAQKAAAEARVSSGGKFSPPPAPGHRTLQ